MITLTDLVVQWWAERVDAGAQVRHAPEIARPAARERRWKEMIRTEDLWIDFNQWSKDKYGGLFTVDPPKRNGFFTVFYQVSGAKKGLMRHSGQRYPVAKFRNRVTKQREEERAY